jgi:hypothetical protein
MMKKLLLSAALLGCFTATASAMDDAERARQMELYKSQNAGGAMVTTTTTTAPTPMPEPFTPHALPAGAPSITASKAMISRSMPVDETTTTTQQTTVTTATAAPAPIAKQMSPLNDDGTPMDVPAKASTLGATEVSGAAAASTLSEHDREMQAYKEWQASQTPITQSQTTTTTTTTTAQPAVQPNAMLAVPDMTPVYTDAAIIPDRAATTTMDEKTTTTNYTVSQRKVGLVGNRPYQPVTTQVSGGVTREVAINGVPRAPEVVVPDTVASMANTQATGNYYSSRQAARYYKDTGVQVHDTGALNGE